MQKFNSVDEYIAHSSDQARPKLTQIRQLILTGAPDAEEKISWGMPGYKYLGNPLIYFGGFKNHISLFPAGDVEMFKSDLEGYTVTKGTIQFQFDKPLPAELIQGIVNERISQIEAGKDPSKH